MRILLLRLAPFDTNLRLTEVVPMIWRWIKRGVWLTAWAVWAVAGVVVYRELPLDLGNPIAKLPINGDDVVGFVNDKPLLVTLTEGNEHGPSLVRVWDARNAIVLKEWAVPGNTPFRWSPVHGFLLFQSRSEGSRKPCSLNVMSGEWR